ncbi:MULTISPECIES: 5-(carboxyamino)imidazole ribonucleotide synthase [Pontibacillus]|uniref:N5-carboxyaminoimidazole ribonucleotide synthase n=1 Tax=Pontibacillus chungwhensis TaxID=265426 RepID=A0ABY8UZ38_9BACI|nr:MULTISPECIES: 5-(carboxyamino)imidazole ribonucleotide synthase [Pontibacillus]MCD5325340.1 5-(carboxyamino)imidazole ribonucleotide synthase [Pontibacillus sp. HN14]WIF98458.1 5-(carboxyamino)imidazole ribonucleotide synthase [Pontibacillus chungwhensis]
MNQILPNSTIGILGGGQLGRMMALSAKQMGYRIAVQDPAENGPCAQIADIHIPYALDSIEGAERLAEVSDVITYEFENVDLSVAKYLVGKGKLPQGTEGLEVTQNREREKKRLDQIGIPVAPYQVLEHADEALGAVNAIGFPCVIKTIEGGYDGKGQMRLGSMNELTEAQTFIEGVGSCVIESWLPFDQEISVIITRGIDGETTVFPVPANHHEHHMLRESIVPAPVSEEVLEKAETYAVRIAANLKVVGTFAIEMFVVGEDVFVNEMAPRPHNTGHYTIEACNVSQFDQHIRAICGLPLMKVDTPYAAVMRNIIGEEAEAYSMNPYRFMDCHVHLYGKDLIKPMRKMGHVTALGKTVEEARAKIDQDQVVSGQ